MIEGMGALNRRLAAITDHRKMLGNIGALAITYAKGIYVSQSRKTGNLGRTIRLGTVTRESVDIIAGGERGVGYARSVEFGTKPHVIVPRNKPMLAWPADPRGRRLSGSARKGYKGAWIRAKRVNHPGTQAKPYLRPGAERAIRETGVAGIVKAWNEAA